jgi:hypothetical protein
MTRRPRPAAARDRGARQHRIRRRIEALIGIDDVEEMMRRPPRSAAVGFAVPISSPRYTCRESQLTISAPQRSASDKDTDVFPLPVGPTSAMISAVIQRKRLHTEATEECRALSVSPCLRGEFSFF